MGTPVAEVRLYETLHEQGDALRYVYDYGDSWEPTLLVESVREASEDSRGPGASTVGVLRRRRTAAGSPTRSHSPRSSTTPHISTSTR